MVVVRRNNILILVVALALVAFVSAARPISVGPTTRTQVQEVYDCDTQGLGGPCDMAGAQEGVNAVRYSQGSTSALFLTFGIPYGHPNATYDVFLTCGASHALSCGFVTIGQIVTDGNGVGTGTFTVPCATLLALHANGYKTDHVDVGSEAAPNEFLVAGAINYHQSCSGSASSSAKVHAGDAAA